VFEKKRIAVQEKRGVFVHVCSMFGKPFGVSLHSKKFAYNFLTVTEKGIAASEFSFGN
jgi:hypothetical protein